MIYLFEQYGYNQNDFYDLRKDQEDRLECIKAKGYSKLLNRKYAKKGLCFKVEYDHLKSKYHFQTSFYVGIDWVVNGKVAIYVQPKQNKNGKHINYTRMLFEAMQDPENFKHLDGLLDIDFNGLTVPIKQKEDVLSPFLIIQFLQVLRAIVRKGLKKSYYKVTENLDSRVKGKVLISSTIKNNVMKGKQTRTVCRYDEFGINCDENKILKKALHFAVRYIQSYPGLDHEQLKSLVYFISPAFEQVTEDVDIREIKQFKPNPLYKEYETALRLALFILKRFSYNINQTENQMIDTPPFWIDMSKLFELYVYEKLRKIFPNKGDIQYHIKSNYQELDYLVNSLDSDGNELKMVVDAKYKPKYAERNIATEDIRQLAGYARMKNIYEKLDLSAEQNIECLIIYSDQTKADEDVSLSKIRSCPDKDYVGFYKIGLRLPEIMK